MTGFKKGAFFSVSFGIMGKVFSFFSSLLLAFLFGSSVKADIYFYLLLTMFFVIAWINRINSHLVVPEFIHRCQRNKKEAIDFANFFLGVYFICTVFIVGLSALFPSQILGLISDFNKEQINQGLLLVFLSSLHFCFYFITVFLTNLCESFKLFKIYFLYPFNSLFPLILLFFLRRIEAMFLGYILAEIIQIIVCLFSLRVAEEWHLSFKKPVFTRKFTKDFWMMQPNNFISMLLGYVPLWLISGMQAGVVSAINYARMISDTPNDVLITKINNISKVKLTQEAAVKNQAGVQSTFLRTDRFLCFLLIPLGAFTSIFARDIVEMLFMRGNFNLQDARNAAFFLQFFIIVIPFSALNTNFYSLLSAKQLIKETTIRYAVLAFLAILMYIFAIKTWGAFSYPIVGLIYCALTAICNIITLKQFTPFINYLKHILQMLGLLLASVLLAFVIKNLGLYQGNIFIKIFINGITFVSLQFLLFYKTGFLRTIREDLNV